MFKGLHQSIKQTKVFLYSAKLQPKVPERALYNLKNQVGFLSESGLLVVRGNFPTVKKNKKP